MSAGIELLYHSLLLALRQTAGGFSMQEMGVIPYSFSGIAEYPHTTQQPVISSQVQGVYIALHPDHHELILSKVMGWFAERPEIELVDTGISDKAGLGYIILEWIEHEIDQLFLAILRDEEIIADYTVYIRDREEV
jgi:hypothetical protein